MTTSYLVVIPAVDRDALIGCVLSLKVPAPNLLVVDNSGGDCLGIAKQTYLPPNGWNYGTSWAWGLAARRVVRERRDFLVICSTSVTAGPDGLAPFLGALDPDLPLVESLKGWKCIAVNRTVFDKIGWPDPHLAPAYFEDLEFICRMYVAGLIDLSPEAKGRKFVDGGLTSAGNALTLRSGRVEVNMGALAAYVKAKWNVSELHYGDPERLEAELASIYRTPFNSGRPIGWYEPVSLPELEERYGISLRVKKAPAPL